MTFAPQKLFKTLVFGSITTFVPHAVFAADPPFSSCNADEKICVKPPIGKGSTDLVSKISPSKEKLVPSLLGKAVPDDRLGALRGGIDTFTSSAMLGGVVTGNAATNTLSGSNFIDAGSFANSTGIPVVIQNTGANVLIQNATVINLQLK